MLDFAVKLTKTPGAMSRSDVERLGEVGFDDVAISDIVQVAAMFNYYDRLADGLGLDAEPEWLEPGGMIDLVEEGWQTAGASRDH